MGDQGYFIGFLSKSTHHHKAEFYVEPSRECGELLPEGKEF